MNYRILIYALLFSVFVPSCTGDFEEINTNPTNPASVPSDFLFANGQWLINQQGFWVFNVLHLGNWMQHFGNQNKGFSMAHYVDRGQDFSGFWTQNYLLLADFQEAKNLIVEQETGEVALVKDAIVEVLMVETWYYLTQLLGDIPYTDALKGVDNVSPAYDEQQAIISDLFSRLDAAVSVLRGASIPAFGTADAFYDSNVSQWVKYGNSLMLRMALGVIKGDAALAQQMATKAMAGPLLESNADNAILPTDNAGPAYRHPLWDLDGLATSDRPFVGETFVNTLLALDDPRLPYLISATQNSIAAGGALEYRGIPAAPDDAIYAEVNTNLDDYSFPNANWVSGRVGNYNKGINRMTFAEVSFLKAEAALRSWGSTPGAAQGFFEAGIRAAMAMKPFSDAGLTETMVNDYIAANGTLSGTTDEQLNQIITQKWILFFVDQEFDAFIDWRRTGFPTLLPGANPGETNGVIPRRFKYSESEPILNESNFNAASSKIGGNTFVAKIWTDK